MKELITNAEDFSDDPAIKLLNPAVGFKNSRGVITNFNSNLAEVKLFDGKIGHISITEFYPNRNFALNDSYDFLVLKDGEHPILTVAHPNLVLAIFEGLAPELREGKVRTFGIVRRMGIRTKLAVASTEEGLDPVGIFVGKAANRIKEATKRLAGERVDIIPFHPNKEIFIANALGVKVDKITLNNGVYEVYVPKHQYRAAIGGGGLNVALAARLTEEKITIKIAE